MLASFGIGFIIASTAPNMKAATAIANAVYFPMLFLTGATVPLELMPDTMRNISRAFPLTYAVELLKGVWLGGSLLDYTVQIIVLASVFVAGIIVSILLFRWE
jgi:ABC-2 type transport system permease protein